MARLSTKPRKFLCETCKKTYISKGGLLRHCKTHLIGAARDKEMYHCHLNGCNFRTLQRSNLRVHINVVHLRVQNLVCHECEPAYQTGDPANMTRHKIRKHGQSSTDKRWSRSKHKIQPVDLTPLSPSSPALSQISQPGSPSPSIETAPEPRHDVLAASHSSLLRYYLPSKPFLHPPLPPILDRLTTSVRYPAELCSSPEALPSLASLILPRPPLPSSAAPPFIPLQLHPNTVRALDISAHDNHLHRTVYSHIPPKPVHSRNEG
ncbi:hypothetical protein F5146DRAFT_246759 [Armillaria mellea]|nr:hypothetical protein F5146DRAFT_246759 [Armillaria mellea]